MLFDHPPGIIWNVYEGPTLLGIVNEENERLAKIAAGWFMRANVYVIRASTDARHRRLSYLFEVIH